MMLHGLLAVGNNMERKRLSDSDWLFTVLTALVKRSGGELRVGQEDLLDVSKKDFIGLYLDKKDKISEPDRIKYTEEIF